ncbi:GNAT family N-acetyltransferase [Spirosoma montaniterrae]|uniref:GNAT family acetyltransferase n=1 Tax=Spirosoma montaniterrae TaxID=1178516 RepID=A0A1P9X440_9BACT|nr:GNAT family N-acetyltransferase [Spirosoma montaniterrae]AQG82410.1 GNAT family acetyltransferase [Spirosoma montaniterrae]
MITVAPISSPTDLDIVFGIRHTVFVVEQHVAHDEEYDEFESISTHFLARVGVTPAGTARWRRTSNGIKLERFAVLPAFRRQGVGQALVQAVLDDVFAQQQTAEPTESIYLHAQLTAMPLYAGFGFAAVGPMFEEAGIQHYKMVLTGSAYPNQ